MTLPFVTSALLPPNNHGFFGRQGGVSKGIFTSLNCGAGSDDVASDVQTNKGLVAAALNANPDTLLTTHQIHSAKVVEVNHEKWPDDAPKADAMVTGLKNISLGVVTADCAPILFCDPSAKIIGAAHAGWQGAVAGIAGNTIDAMVKLGASRSNIRAVVGPCISQANYEVGQEFLETFMDYNPDYSRFFINGAADKYQFDLPSFVVSQLNEQQIHSTEWVKKCTYALEDEYFSYRRKTHRNEPDYGRQLSVITNSVD